MGFRRNGGTYAARAKPAQIDWTAEFAARDRVRAETAAADQAALDRIFEQRMEADPMYQLVKRCSALEERQVSFEQQLNRIEEQISTLIQGRRQ